MKRFLRGLFIFLLFPTVFIICFFMLVSSKTKELTLNNNINDLYMGDSHVQYAINDSILINSKNLAAASEAYFFTYYKLKLLLKSNPNIRKIYLGYSYHNLSKYYDDFVFGKFSEYISPTYFYILPFEDQIKMLNYNRNKLSPYLKGTLKVGIKILLNKSPLIDGYQNNFTKVTAVKKIMDERLLVQYYNNENLNEFSSFNISNLNKIIELCKSYNIELVLLNTPLNTYYKSKLPIEYINMFNKILNSNKLKLIDFNNLQLPDSFYIPDGDHLSKEGSFYISNKLKNK